MTTAGDGCAWLPPVDSVIMISNGMIAGDAAHLAF